MARQGTQAPLATVTLHGVLEGTPWQKFEELRKDGSALVHGRMFAGQRRQKGQTGQAKLKSCTPSWDTETLWKLGTGSGRPHPPTGHY